MKTTIALFIPLVFNTFLFSQNFYSDFEDGTLQGWTNTDGTLTHIAVEETPPYLFLQKVSDGTNTAIGEMAIINSDENYWAGNYFYEVIDTDVLHTVDDIVIKNDNNFDLHLRYGFKGANDYIVVTTNPIIVPALSDWEIYNQSYYLESPLLYNLSVINDTSGMSVFEVFEKVHELFLDVVEFKIFHNENIFYEGEFLTGTLQIESIMSYTLLANESQDISEFVFYPNPVNDIMKIKLPNTDYSEVKIYNLLGEEIRSYSFSERTNNINLSELNSGVYMAKIKTGNKTVTKKIIKL